MTDLSDSQFKKRNYAARSWPKVSIEIGGPPPSRKAYSFNPPFFLNWFGGDDASRRQLTIFVPFVKVRIYP